MTISELWKTYAKNKSNEVRNRIFMQYQTFLSYQTGRIMAPPGLERDDLYQYGAFGLMEAIEKFDEKAGAKFETFATHIIKGRITDRIRDFGKASGGPSRTAIKKSKEIERAMKKLENEFKRAATPQEIAKELGVSVKGYQKMLGDISIAVPISLDKMIGLDDNVATIDVIKNEKSENPEDTYLQNERHSLIADLIDHYLSEKERMVVVYYYYEQLTLIEIGRVMNLSESRISQIHTQAMLRLKNKLIGEGTA